MIRTVDVSAPRFRRHAPRWIGTAMLLTLGMSLVATAAQARSLDGPALRARYERLDERLAASPFGRPLLLESSQTEGTLSGDVYAVVEYPFARVRDALQSPAHWCDIVLLHVNVKGCQPVREGGKSQLALEIGRKRGRAGVDTHTLLLDFHVAASSHEALKIVLAAEDGPLGTRDYDIALSAIPIDERRTFVHFGYEYEYALPARLAVETYLATLGRDKVGFTIVRHADGRTVHQGGLRGMVERTTMRLYLAVDAFLSTHGLPPPERAERRLRTWFESTRRYARQLREMDEAEYLSIKRGDLKQPIGTGP